MTKEEYMKIAEAEYEKITALQEEDSFYEYEKQFEEIWIELGRKVFERSISKTGENRRKKKVK